MGTTFKALSLIFSIILVSCASKPIPRVKGSIERNFEKEAAKQDKTLSYLQDKEFLKASDALERQDFETSAKILKKLSEDNVEDQFLRRKLAVTLIKGSKMEESLPVLKRVFEDSKYKDTQIGLVLGGVYTGLEDRGNAEKTYQKILKVDPKHVDACVFLGKSYAVTKDFNKAKKLLTKCSKVNKTEGIFNYYIGKMYVDKGDLKKAMSYFKKALKQEPSYSQAALGIGLLYEQEKKNKKAVETYKKFLKSYRNDVVILNRVVSLLFAMQRYNDVVPYAERLSDFDPDNLNLKVKLGILYTDVKDYQKAVSVFKRLLKQSPQNDKLLYYLGAIYQETKEYENAIEYFSLITPESGLYQDSSVQIAQMLSKVAKLDTSKLNQFVGFVDEKSKELPSLAVEFKVIEANYFQERKQFDLAINSLLSVQKSEMFKENHNFYLASLYESSKEFDEAYKIMFSILKENPKNAHALNFLGYSFVERNIKLDEAKKFLVKASNLKPSDGYIKDSLGWYYYKVGDTQKALSIITEASKLVTNDASIQKHLAVIYARLNNFKMAKKFLKNAIKYTSSDSSKQELESFIKLMDTNRLPASFK